MEDFYMLCPSKVDLIWDGHSQHIASAEILKIMGALKLCKNILLWNNVHGVHIINKRRTVNTTLIPSPGLDSKSDPWA